MLKYFYQSILMICLTQQKVYGKQLHVMHLQMAQAMYDGISMTEIIKNVPELQNLPVKDAEKR